MLDPDRLLWRPGEKLISIPAPPPKLSVLTTRPFLEVGDIVTFGHFCAYVGVGREHPLYGRPHEELSGGLDVHDGVNYSASCEGYVCHVPAPGMPDEVWWIGCDFGRTFDLSPGRVARFREAQRMAVEAGAPWASSLGFIVESEVNGDEFFPRPIYRELPYVRRQCERLAEQLARLR